MLAAPTDTLSGTTEEKAAALVGRCTCPAPANRAPAQAAYKYFCRWLVDPDVRPFAPVAEEVAWARFAGALHEPYESCHADVYEPVSNPALLLVSTLGAMDGFQPDKGYDAGAGGEARGRIASVELAELLHTYPRRLARTFRGVGVEPRTLRFYGLGVTKGYAREDVQEAWDGIYGKVLVEIDEQLDKWDKGAV